MFDVRTGEVRTKLSHQGVVSSVAFSPDGNKIARADPIKTARVFSDGRELSRIAFQGKVRTVDSALMNDRWQPDRKMDQRGV